VCALYNIITSSSSSKPLPGRFRSEVFVRVTHNGYCIASGISRVVFRRCSVTPDEWAVKSRQSIRVRYRRSNFRIYVFTYLRFAFEFREFVRDRVATLVCKALSNSRFLKRTRVGFPIFSSENWKRRCTFVDANRPSGGGSCLGAPVQAHHIT